MLTLDSILHCTGSSSTNFFDTISTATVSTVAIASLPAIRVSVSLCLVSLIAYSFKICPILNGLASQTATPSTSQEDADRNATNVMWAILAIVLLVAAILLTIAGIALGTIYLPRKPVKSVMGSKLKPHQGKYATPFSDYTHASTHTHTCIHCITV